MGIVIVPLGHGYVSVIDEADAPKVLAHRWWTLRDKRAGVVYARGKFKINGKWRTLLLARWLLNVPEGVQVDHVNGDTLDNRRENLRVCSPRQNSQNRHRTWGRKLYKGITWHKQHRKWSANIKTPERIVHLGLFRDPVEAARAYDRAARFYFGEFARPNFS